MSTTATAPTAIPADRALSIAQVDAVIAYRDLKPFRIQLTLEADGWHVDFELKDPRMKGGGPHYIVDATTGVITAKRYEQ